MTEQWVDVYPKIVAIADAKNLDGEDRKAFLAGYHLRNDAATFGWVDDGIEGAYEFITRRICEDYESDINSLTRQIFSD